MDTATRIAVVTGGNTGLGYETAKKILLQGDWTVILACRDPKKAAAAVASLEQIIPNSSTVSFLPLDLSIKQSVESFVKSFPYPRIDLLLCNAGCVNASLTHAWGNLEATFAANHLGHFALVMLLIKRGVLPGNGSSRVVVVSSGIHVPGRSPTGGPKFDFDNLKNSVEPYDSMVAYANSKLANVWFSYELARWVKEKGLKVTVNCLSPGFVPNTSLSRTSPWPIRLLMTYVLPHTPFSNTLEGASKHMEWVCTSPDLEGVSGKYLDSRCAGNPNGGFGSSEESKDMEKARRLWNVSCDLTGLYEFKTD